MTLEQLIQEAGIRLQYASVRNNAKSMPGVVAWEVTLHYEKRRFTITYHTEGSVPELATVVLTLCNEVRGLDGTTSFEDWATKHGVNPDSRAWEQVWRTVWRMAPKFRNFLGSKAEEFLRCTPMIGASPYMNA